MAAPSSVQSVSLEAEARSITRRVRRSALAWFILITALLLGAGGYSFYRLRQTILVLTDEKVEAIGNNLVSQLKITDAIYRRMSLGGARVLQADYLALGEPRLMPGSVTIGGQQLPDLRFGGQSLTDRPDLLEGVLSKMGGTATVFAVERGQFIRVLTNVRDDKGGLAVGTPLFVVLGTVTAVWAHPLFVRMTPVGPWEFVATVLTAFLGGVTHTDYESF